MHFHRLKLAAALLLAAASSACSDLTTASPGTAPAPAGERRELLCTVTVAEGTLQCGEPSGGPSRNLIIGGQGLNVRVVSQNAHFVSGDNLFAVDVALQNLLDQPLGTDGETQTATRIFFINGPVATAGTGVVTVLADSSAMFTEAEQPYYVYPGTIEPRQLSDFQTWTFSMDPAVERFQFWVLVQTEVPSGTALLHLRPERGITVFDTHLNDVWAASEHDVFAVGGATVVHFDGNYWRGMDLRSGPCECVYELTGVWGTGPRNVYAVGTAGNIVRWTGQEWEHEYDGDIGFTDLYAVWGSSATDVWAVGEAGTILHSDGSDWTDSQPTSGELRDVWGSGPADVWTVGSGGTVLHYDGASWTPVAGLQGDFTAVWGTGPADVWIAGSVEFGNGRLYHWDGATWTVITDIMVLGGVPMTDGWSGAPDDVWVTRGQQTLHWNGTAWSVQDVNERQELRGITGAGGRMFVVGELGFTAGGDGTGWTPITVDSWDSVYSLWGSSPSDVWAVGGSTILRRGADSIWTTALEEGSAFFTDVWGASASEVWITDRLGTVRRWNGTSFSTVPTPGEMRHWNTVWGTSATDVWVGGYNGDLLRWNGSGWTEYAVPSPYINALWGSGSGNVFAVGENGGIFRWNGTSWTSMNSGTNQPLAAVWGTGPANVYAVGGGGTVLHYDGNADGTWTSIDAGVWDGVVAIWGSGPNDVYLVSSNGLSLNHWNGTAWKRVISLPSNAGVWMYALWGTSRNDFYAAGDLGTIWRGTR